MSLLEEAMSASSQGLGDAVGCLHEAGHGVAGAVMDQLLHPLYGHLIILPQPQLLLHTLSHCH